LSIEKLHPTIISAGNGVRQPVRHVTLQAKTPVPAIGSQTSCFATSGLLEPVSDGPIVPQSTMAFHGCALLLGQRNEGLQQSKGPIDCTPVVKDLYFIFVPPFSYLHNRVSA